MDSKIINAVNRELGDSLSDEQIKAMRKVDIFDKYINSFKEKISSSEVCFAVLSIYGVELETVPVLLKEDFSSPRDLIDRYLNQSEGVVTSEKIREIINHIFGVNLFGISSLYGSGISLYSKNRWMCKNEDALFEVHTGPRDIDAIVYPTKYFMERTGLTQLPNELQKSLIGLGYYYDEKIGSYYYLNPTGEPVPDAFKVRTMGTIIEVVRHSYSDLI
jgi:hypothetical protein